MINVFLMNGFPEQMGASDRRVRQIKEGRSETVRTSLRRIDGGRRSPDHQVRRDLHLPQDQRRAQGQAPHSLRVHAHGLHFGNVFLESNFFKKR